tara:strand:- start:2173 stop:2700 length:528 start_codon:yes stop_codon:yes gene_type:complete
MSNQKQAIIDARMRNIKVKMNGPTPDYSINKGVKDWDPIFFWACEQGDIKKMKKALKKGGPAVLNWQNPSNMNTPAHVAAWMGKSHGKVLKWLKKKGADMSLKDTQGRTASDVWATTKDQKDMTKSLARYRAIQAKKKEKDLQRKMLADKKKALLSGDLSAIAEMEALEAASKKK